MSISITALDLSHLLQSGATTNQVPQWNGSQWVPVTISGTGTVTSVAMTVPSIMSVSGSPITTSGTLAVSLNSQAQNLVLASPNGLTGTPAFRALVASDIPALAYVSSVGLSLPSIFTVSGSPVTSSGTLSASLNAQSGNVVLASPSDGSSGTPAFRALVAADIPTLSTSKISGLAASATTDTTNASNISSGTLPLGRLSGSYTGITGVGTITAGTWNGSVIGVQYGGTGLSATTLGDIYYASAANTISALGGNTTSTKKFLTQTGTGSVSAAPGWDTITATDLAASPTTNYYLQYNGASLVWAAGSGGGGGISGSGTSNQVTYWNGTSSVTGSNNLQFNGTGLGIGGAATSGSTLTIDGYTTLQGMVTPPTTSQYTSQYGTVYSKQSDGYLYYIDAYGTNTWQLAGGVQPGQIGILYTTPQQTWSAAGSPVTWTPGSKLFGSSYSNIMVTGIGARWISGSPGSAANFSMTINSVTVFGSRHLPYDANDAFGNYLTSYTETSGTIPYLKSGLNLTLTSAGTFSAAGVWQFDVFGYYF